MHENSLRKKDAKIVLCDFSDIRHIFKKYHYKKEAIGGGISYCFALVVSGKIMGGAVTGLPRHNEKYKGCIDIRRMACFDESPKNSESFFLGKIIQYIASKTDFKYILSYSDKTVNHFGTIYKASNFINIGETAKSQHIVWNGKSYHMRSLTIERDYSKRLKEAIKTKEAEIITGLEKIIWLYTITEKQSKKIFDIENIGEKGIQPTLF